MTFEEWLEAINDLAAADGAVSDPGIAYTDMTGAECWRASFDDGLSPEEAWDEEKAAGV
jgi:hypothetical protein